jgi:hypothetical protein
VRFVGCCPLPRGGGGSPSSCYPQSAGKGVRSAPQAALSYPASDPHAGGSPKQQVLNSSSDGPISQDPASRSNAECNRSGRNRVVRRHTVQSGFGEIVEAAIECRSRCLSLCDWLGRLPVLVSDPFPLLEVACCLSLCIQQPGCCLVLYTPRAGRTLPAGEGGCAAGSLQPGCRTGAAASRPSRWV